jgi:Ca-activated chloride channel family protein
LKGSHFLAGVLVLCTAQLAAQQPAFKTGVELIRVPVSLTQGNKPVEPGVLTAADFKVTEDGVAQPVALFERESLPLSLCIVVDASGSMAAGSAAQFAIAALRQVLTRLLPEDEVSIIAFAGHPVVVASWTPAPDVTRFAMKMEPDGSTSLNDAVVTALEVINGAHNPRPVVLLITDGGENSSRAPLSQIVTTRRQSETQVYAFNVVSPASAQRSIGRGPDGGTTMASSVNLDILPRLIGDSGGFEYRVRSGMDAANLARAFVDDLRFQYTLGYTPLKAFDGKYRRVKIEVTKRGFRVRHRGGYLALPLTPQP